MTSRRTLLLAIIGISCVRSVPALAISPFDLSELGKALGYAADAVGKLGDNIAHLVSLGTQGWNAVSARRTRDRLRELSASLQQVHESNSEIKLDFDDYANLLDASTYPPRAEEVQSEASKATLAKGWHDLTFQGANTLLEISSLLKGLREERSGLVTQEVYQDLLDTLNSRANILNRLSTSSAPLSRADLPALRLTANKYKELSSNLTKAIHALNAYIHDPTTAQ